MPPSKFLKLSHLTTRLDRMLKISWRDRWCTNRLLQRIYTILDYVSTNLADKARLHHQYSWSCSLVDRRQSRWFHTACTSTSKSLSEHPDSLHVAWKCLRRRSSEVLAFSHAPVEQTVLVSCFDSLIQQCLIRRRIKSLQIWNFSDTHSFGSVLCRVKLLGALVLCDLRCAYPRRSLDIRWFRDVVTCECEDPFPSFGLLSSLRYLKFCLSHLTETVASDNQIHQNV